MNAKMPELKAALEGAGFTDVKTVLASGNVVFAARRASNAVLERKLEAAMKDRMTGVIERDPVKVDRLRSVCRTKRRCQLLMTRKPRLLRQRESNGSTFGAAAHASEMNAQELFSVRRVVGLDGFHLCGTRLHAGRCIRFEIRQRLLLLLLRMCDHAGADDHDQRNKSHMKSPVLLTNCQSGYPTGTRERRR